MRVALGIDVSKATLNYAILTDLGEIKKEGKVSNDLIGLETMLSLQQEYKAETIFEATGVYSRRIQYFLALNEIPYVKMNPLKAKKEMDTLRVTKNDRIDAIGLARLQLDKDYPYTVTEKEIYIELRYRHRFYQEIVTDSITAKNRLKRALQDTFSELENLYVGDNPIFYEIVKVFPHVNMVKNKSVVEIVELLEKNTIGRVNSIRKKAEQLIELAGKTSTSCPKDSYIEQEVIQWANKVIETDKMKSEIIEGMVELASQLTEFEIIKSIPGFGETSAVTLIAELGDIRRFRTPQKINAFIGIDLRFNDSGQRTTSGHITKRGSNLARKIMYQDVKNMLATASRTNDTSNYVTNWYYRRKEFEQNGSKKIIIGAMDRTLRLIHHLVINDEMFERQE
ncbi:IS110 family transposase [Weissella coleopterorum]|uniref:IS110 family transposase n=1 Tax=Weissella coleopterorum TaxID=2714949 RepID=A0A6G8AXY3_9LACO|nr:IS110 family transposase [Weissella coleopterorum]QIL49914.1 IS110 family transposase [Weissella coleopterorum]